MPYIWSTSASMRLLLSLRLLTRSIGLVAQLLEAAFLAGGKFVGAERGFDAARPAACRASCRARRSRRASPAPAASARLPSRESDRLPSSSKSSSSAASAACGALRRLRRLFAVGFARNRARASAAAGGGTGRGGIGWPAAAPFDAGAGAIRRRLSRTGAAAAHRRAGHRGRTPPYIASRSMMSRSSTLPSFSSSRHTVSASKVSGLSHKRADHQLAAGLDALGDGDFAFARQKLDRAHLAQIHAHRIVGAVICLVGASR